jgi:exodeoxyribonuclease V alpha subunit
MDYHEELIGTVDRFLFRNEENGFSIFIITMVHKSSAIAKGYLSNVQPGQQICLKGSWVMHAKFGRQFDAISCSVKLPESIVGLKKYLGSGLIKGIGKAYAEKLVNYFGARVLEVIDQEPDRLKEVEGIGQKRLELIIKAWHDQKEISHLIVFLQDKGVSTTHAMKIYKKYGKESIALVTENPYRLAEDIWGIGFKTADAIALKLGIEKNSVKRIKAAMLFVLSESTTKGHLYYILEDLKKETTVLLELEQQENQVLLKTALHELYDRDKIKLITYEEKHFVTTTAYYFSEKGVAARLQNLMQHPSRHEFNLDAIYKKISVDDGTTVCLNEDQQRGIMTCLQQKITIITGGPGTGKTTLIKKLLEILDDNKVTYRLAAPTGRAAKRIIEGTGRYAVTLHRLLEFDVSIMNFAHNEQNALKLDFLIIDETSMVDIFLAHALLKAIPHHAHLLLIGDCDQLPSVGAGNFLNDMIASEKIPTVCLTQIFRQAQDSMIIINAHRVNKGEFPASFLPEARKDFFFIKEDKPEQVIEHLRNIFFHTLKKFGINHDDAAVLVPMNRGIVGTIKLNQDLQALLNPDPQLKTIQFGGTVFKVGDKVMQIRNNYDKSVFNGDCGIIDDIDLEDRILKVYFLERLIEYEFDEFNELVLAYTLSIHKSQGSEYSAVIIPLFMQHFMLLQRNLIYTAITRAKKLCIIIGETKALAMAVKNNKTAHRITFLQQYLTTDLACR